MELAQPLVRAEFVTRLNRFALVARVEGEEVVAHVANSGRLGELLLPANPLYLSRAPSGSQRKTSFDLVLVEVGGTLVSADARAPNRLVEEAISSNLIEQFTGYDDLRREVTCGRSRFDFMMSRGHERLFVEVKSVTLVEDGMGLFPDSPTTRGRKHVQGLKDIVSEGGRGAVVFVVQRPDVKGFSPNVSADPEFWEAMDEAMEAGVEAYAYRCSVTKSSIAIQAQIPILPILPILKERR